MTELIPAGTSSGATNRQMWIQHRWFCDRKRAGEDTIWDRVYQSPMSGDRQDMIAQAAAQREQMAAAFQAQPTKFDLDPSQCRWGVERVEVVHEVKTREALA